ncbi:hypothetical protein RchiOBHm_Chr5g0011861 [Rosa chinensis]|uniref:Uncharacterized protein n=1 Tax=Rosa chinensis TaxID=74649 RepID=A0A2P6Q4Y7_ROSCH|nr:hypothetical protein RchiOBHm_Chr5g0011861 [Rosa chinensis]
MLPRYHILSNPLFFLLLYSRRPPNPFSFSSHSTVPQHTPANPIPSSTPIFITSPRFHHLAKISSPRFHHLTKNLLTQFIILHHFPKKIKGLLLPTSSIAHQHKEILLLVKSRGLISSWVHVCL